MSFREKSAWISLFVHALVFGVFFFMLAMNWPSWLADTRLSVGLLFSAMLALVVIAGALTAATAAFSPRDAHAPEDEREKMVALKAAWLGSIVMTVGVVGSVGVLLLGWTSVLVAYILIAVLVVSEITKAIAQIAYFRASI